LKLLTDIYQPGTSKLCVTHEHFTDNFLKKFGIGGTQKIKNGSLTALVITKNTETGIFEVL
jgi:hypothetical protein